MEALVGQLADKNLLLVLDNLEHLLEAAPEVAALLEGCPGLTVLATSRAPLRIRGEHEYPVPPLGLPASTRSPAEEDVLASPAGTLFAERARAASPGFYSHPRERRGGGGHLLAAGWAAVGAGAGGGEGEVS
jgi:predicted ATPase